MADDPKGGTPEVSGNAGTPEVIASGETADQRATRLEAELKAKNAEMLTWKDKIEDANRIREAEAARVANEAARATPPTRGADNGDYVSSITPQDIEQYRMAARSDDPGVAAWGKGILASLQLGNNASLGLRVTTSLMDVPKEDRPAVKKMLERHEARDVEDAQRRLEIERLRIEAEKGRAAIAKLGELEKQPRAPEPGTHVRSTPGTGPAADQKVYTQSQLTEMYRSGDRAQVAKARDIERQAGRGQALIQPD